MNIIFKGGKVCSEEQAPYEADVLVEEGIIKAVGSNLPDQDGAEVIDITGKLIMPSMFDAHVHMREPGHRNGSRH